MKNISIRLIGGALVILVFRLAYLSLLARKDNVFEDLVVIGCFLTLILALLFYLYSLWIRKKARSLNFLFHLSLTALLVVFFLNETWTESGYIPLLEGESVSHYLDKNKIRHPLPFSMQCLDFKLETFPGTFRTKSFVSKLKIGLDNQEQLKELRVNSPITIKNYKLFQSDHGLEINPNHWIKITVDFGNQKDTFYSKIGDTTRLRDGTLFSIVDFSPSWASKEEQIYTFDPDSLLNPACLIRLASNFSNSDQGWVTASQLDGKKVGHINIKIDDIWGLEYTVISVIRAPFNLVVIFLSLLTAGLGALILVRNKKCSHKN